MSERTDQLDCRQIYHVSPQVRWLAVVAVAALFAVSLYFRLIWLHRIPGTNGDEAWYGVQIQRWLAGRSWSFFTPSGLPTNPMLLLTEWGLLRILEPSFTVLRLPIALWACAGLGLGYFLHHWVFGDRVEALLVTALTACLPAHLAYSRLCWDASFGLVTLPLLLYGTLKLASGEQPRRALGLFLAGSVLSLWVHVTNAVCVTACLLVLAWAGRRQLWRVTRQILPPAVVLVSASGVAMAAMVIATARLVWWLLVYADAGSAARLFKQLVATRIVADLLFGPRLYEYLAGVPVPGWRNVIYVVLLAVACHELTSLYMRGGSGDRAVVLLVALLLGMMPVLAPQLRLAEAGYERYVLYWVPLGVVVWVRAFGAFARRLLPRVTGLAMAVHLGVSFLFLVQFWHCYFEPLRQQTYAANLHRTFRTGPQEPKAAAAEAIRRRLPYDVRDRIMAEDWWCQYPLQFLLGSGTDVRGQVERPDLGSRVFVVDYCEGRFAEHVWDELRPWRFQPREREVFLDAAGWPILRLTIFDAETTNESSDDRIVP